MAGPAHHMILCTAKEYEAAMRILDTPVVLEFPKKGVLRRTEKVTVKLSGYVGHSLGHGEFEGRQSIWLIEMNERYVIAWQRIKEVLKDLGLNFTDDGAEEARFLGRA